jgi:stalled ribosome alternative rescue factor ArfA
MKRTKKRTFRRNADAKSLASTLFRQRIVKNRKTYTRKGRRPTDSGLSSWIVCPPRRALHAPV